MMTENEHLLTVLGEEGGEVAKEVSKALRFGLEDKLTLDPAGPRGTEGPTNAEKIVNELNDLLGVARMLVARGVIPENWQSEARQQRKIERVTAYMLYARRVGALEIPGDEETAAEIVAKYGAALIGAKVVTEPFGSWPGGEAVVLEIKPDETAPEIVMQVKHCATGEEVGVFEREPLTVIGPLKPL